MPRVMRISFPPGSPSAPITLAAQAVSQSVLIGAATFTRPSTSTDFTQYVLYDGSTGATSRAFNRKYFSDWDNVGGDWLDANQVEQGTQQYGTITVSNVEYGQKAFLGIENLVTRWLLGDNRGVLLTATGTDFSVRIAGRLYADSTKAPYLSVTTDQGSWSCPVTATSQSNTSDALWIDGRSTFDVQATGQSNAFLQFDLSGVVGSVILANLYVYVTRGPGAGNGTSTIKLFELNPKPVVLGGGSGSVEYGLASQYQLDVNIANHPDVLFATDFSATNSEKDWIDGGTWADGRQGPGLSSMVSRVYDPDSGSTYLRSGFQTGSLWGGGLKRYLMTSINRQSSKPTPALNEVYFRYYVYLEDDWGDTTSDYKMPGISGCFGTIEGYANEDRLGAYYEAVTGNSSDPPTGLYKTDGARFWFEGWSVRGYGGKDFADTNPYNGKFYNVWSYVYDQRTGYGTGDNKYWGAALQKNRWYCIEQYAKMNTLSGAEDGLGNRQCDNNGIYRVWIDGVKVYEEANFQFTRHPDFGIEGIWLNWFHGGLAPESNPTHDAHYRMNHIVAASSYIGPMESALPSWVPAANTLAVVPIVQSLASQVASHYVQSTSAQKIFDFSAPAAALDWSSKGGVVMTGGGHSATNDNSVFVFDIGTRAWTRITNPYNFGLGLGNNDFADFSAYTDDQTGEYPDGQPGSIHSYSILDVIPSAYGGGINGALVSATKTAIGYAGTGPNDTTSAHTLYLKSDFSESWQRVSRDGSNSLNYATPGQSCAYDHTRNRVWISWQGDSNENNSIIWLDLTTQQYGRQFFADYSWSQPLGSNVHSAYMRYDAVHDALILTVPKSGQNVPISYFRCQDPARGWRRATTTSGIPSTSNGETPFGYCDDTQKWYFISNVTRDRVYEVSIPADITQTWTVTAVTLNGGTQLPAFFIVGKAWTYFPSVKCFFLVYNATDIYAYRPTGV